MIRQIPSPGRVTITNSTRSFATPMIAIRSSPYSSRSSMSSSRFGSSRARMASQKSTPCFRRFASRLLLSHSYCTFRILPDTSSFGNEQRWEGSAELANRCRAENGPPPAFGRGPLLMLGIGWRGPADSLSRLVHFGGFRAESVLIEENLLKGARIRLFASFAPRSGRLVRARRRNLRLLGRPARFRPNEMAQGLKVNGGKIIWFEIKRLILHGKRQPLNQRVQGSSPCAPTNDFNGLSEGIFPF